MKEYRTPLPRMFATMLERAMNRLLAMDPESPQRMAGLEDRCLQLDLEDTGITLFFTFAGQSAKIRLDHDGEPDTVITGSASSLFAMAAPEAGLWGMPGSAVSIAGDAQLARELEKLFSGLDPDWEGRLASIFGDVVGFQLASGIRLGAEQLKTAASTGGEIVSDYLGRQSGPLVTTVEFRGFADEVDTVREAVDRLEARVRMLTERNRGNDS